MPQTVRPCQVLDPGQSWRIKEEFWEKFHHKQKAVFGGVKEMLDLEAKEVDEVVFQTIFQSMLSCLFPV